MFTPHQHDTSFIKQKRKAESGGTYGAAFVSNRMCLSFSSWGSGRCCRCFSREFWRTWPGLLMGEMEDSSMTAEREVSSSAIL